MRHAFAAVALTALLTACSAPVDEPADAPDDAAPPATAPAQPPAAEPLPTEQGRVVAALDPEGIRVVVADTGSTRLLAFGAPAAQVRDAVARTREGAVSEGTNAECGAGPLQYAQWSDLTLWFQNGAFVGWATNALGPSTLTGIGVGATRVQLERDYTITVEQTSLGTEFAAGEMYGLIDDGGVVSALWAGASCNFR